MSDSGSRREVWRLYLRNWIPLALMAQLLALCVAASTFTVEIDNTLCQALIVAGAFAVGGRYLFRSEWGFRPSLVLLAFAQLQLLPVLAVPLSYVAASANFPLQDSTLAYFDQLLGLDWQAYYEFAMGRPSFIPYAYVSYAVIYLQPILVPLVLGLTKQPERLQHFVLACTLSICVELLISAALPANGTYF